MKHGETADQVVPSDVPSVSNISWHVIHPEKTNMTLGKPMFNRKIHLHSWWIFQAAMVGLPGGMSGPQFLVDVFLITAPGITGK